MRRDRARLFVLLLLVASFAAPELVWAGVHALEHHGEHGAPDDHTAPPGPEAAAALGALLHGHAHPDNVPGHDHEVTNAPPLRLDPRSPAVQAGALAASGAALAALPAEKAARAVRPAAPAGASPPPLLHLLCTLLI